jgi:hypothetical protein
MTSPRRYVPPDIRRRQRGAEPPDKSHLKPWQRRRPGETESERLDRVYHSCFRCGRHENDMAVLDAHEAECRSIGGADD